MSSNSRTVRRAQSGTTEPAWVKWTLIGVALACVFLFLLACNEFAAGGGGRGGGGAVAGVDGGWRTRRVRQQSRAGRDVQSARYLP